MMNFAVVAADILRKFTHTRGHADIHERDLEAGIPWFRLDRQCIPDRACHTPFCWLFATALFAVLYISAARGCVALNECVVRPRIELSTLNVIYRIWLYPRHNEGFRQSSLVTSARQASVISTVAVPKIRAMLREHGDMVCAGGPYVHVYSQVAMLLYKGVASNELVMYNPRYS